MAIEFDDLVLEFGSASQIPNERLYGYLEENRENLVNLSQLGIQQIPESKLGQEVRRRSKSDLMWLSRYMLWETMPASNGGLAPFSTNMIDEQYYRPVIDLFVKKDDTKSILEQSEVKKRLLLWPRGGAKSTTDHCDTVQWILNFPEIRILYFTAAADLAEGFVQEVKGHYIIREGNPTLMNLFFPEFCLEEKDMGAGDTFTCPVFAAKKIKRKEPTVYAASVGKTKSGWHYELIKADDAVSDKNTESSDQCDSVSKKLFLAQKLLVPGGYYIDYVGTRYADEDHYGVMLDQNVDGEIVASGQGWVRTDNEVTGVSILIGRACQIKPEVAQQLEKEGRPVTYQEAGEQGCILLLPHIMPYKWLMGVYTEDEKSFEGQLNQNPRPASQVTFDRMLLLKNTIPYAEMPNSGPVSQIWDFAFSKKKGRDYTTGSSLIWGTNQEQEPVGYVQEVVRDRFNHATLAKAVVDLAQKYHPFVIGIEGAGGSQMLETAINWEAKKTGDQQVIDVCAHIDWFPPDNQKDAKKVRMAALYPWLLRGGMKFANYCMTPSLEPIYNEFERCLTSHHHDDIPDCLSQHFRLYAPRAYQAVVNDDQSVFSSNDASWNLIFEEGCDPFGNIGFGPPTPTLDDMMTHEDEDMQADPYEGMPSILGTGFWG